MTTVSLNPLSASRAALAVNSLPVTENSTTIGLNSQGSFLAAKQQSAPVPIEKLQNDPTEPPKQTSNGQNQALNGAVIFPRWVRSLLAAKPPIAPVPFRGLQSRPTEPPKQTLNGQNQPLNGAVIFFPVGQAAFGPFSQAG